MKIVTQADKVNMNKLYLELGTYAAVARAAGFSPSTVKKYIIADFKEPEPENVKRFDGALPDFDVKPFLTDDWGALCVLSDEEKEGIHELWEELLV